MTEHGTRSTYVNLKCRCLACTDANQEYHRGLYYGEKLSRDIRKTRRHIHKLAAAGLSQRDMQRISGISAKTICNINTGRAKYVYRATEDAICGIAIPGAPDQPLVTIDINKLKRVITELDYNPLDVSSLTGIKSETLYRMLVKETHKAQIDTADTLACTLGVRLESILVAV